MGFPIQDVATATGLQLYADKGPFDSKAGTLMGFKQGMLLAVAVRAQDSRVCIMLRAKSVSDSGALLSALKADAAMKKTYTLADIKLTTPQTVVWAFNKPIRFKTDEFATALDSMAATASRYAQGLEPGKCESCDADISILTLANGIPTLICEGCKAKIDEQQARAREEYERRQPNPAKALLYGMPTALVLGIVCALVMYFDIREDDSYHVKIFFLIPIALATAVAWAVKTGVRKVTYGACVLASLIALIGIYACDSLFIALYISNLKQEPFDATWLVWSATHIGSLMWWFNRWLTGVGLISGLLGGLICWGMRPKFAVTFTSIQMPAVAKSASGKGESLTRSASV
jgi:hypothetical protein